MGMTDQPRRAPTRRKTDHQRCGESQPIVMVELKFWKQIAEGDAEEHPRCESDCRRGDGRLGAADSGPADDRSDRRDQGIAEIHQVSHAARLAVGGKQGSQSERVERLVKHDCDEQSRTGDTGPGIISGDRGSIGKTGQQSVDAQADQGTKPR